jgi:hypothetical protein
MTRLALILAAGAALSIWHLAPGAAHGWYSPACCSGQDCAQIPASAVTVTPDGYRVDLPPGVHPILRGGVSFVVPFTPRHDWDPAVHPSQDGGWHLCAVETAIRCLYVPEMRA